MILRFTGTGLYLHNCHHFLLPPLRSSRSFLGDHFVQIQDQAAHPCVRGELSGVEVGIRRLFTDGEQPCRGRPIGAVAFMVVPEAFDKDAQLRGLRRARCHQAEGPSQSIRRRCAAFLS